MPTRVTRERRQYQQGVSSTRANEKLAEQGLAPPEQPIGEMPRVPVDLTGLDDSELMRLFRKVTGWQNFLVTQLAFAEVDERDAAKRLERIEGKARSEAEGNNVTEKKAASLSSPDLQRASQLHQGVYAYRKVVQSLVSASEADAFLCSRELSRRLGRNDTDSRSSRYNT